MHASFPLPTIAAACDVRLPGPSPPEDSIGAQLHCAGSPSDASRHHSSLHEAATDTEDTGAADSGAADSDEADTGLADSGADRGVETEPPKTSINSFCAEWAQSTAEWSVRPSGNTAAPFAASVPLSVSALIPVSAPAPLSVSDLVSAPVSAAPVPVPVPVPVSVLVFVPVFPVPVPVSVPVFPMPAPVARYHIQLSRSSAQQSLRLCCLSHPPKIIAKCLRGE
mmetsp:Transcript_33435/g.77141  ORF Transcript_33435/g.77141 Transcript_33435/m.77141 type:complete len:224 (+) Transcript_33435:185-856(+)